MDFVTQQAEFLTLFIAPPLHHPCPTLGVGVGGGGASQCVHDANV
jgi:hypothetical protein